MAKKDSDFMPIEMVSPVFSEEQPAEKKRSKKNEPQEIETPPVTDQWKSSSGNTGVRHFDAPQQSAPAPSGSAADEAPAEAVRSVASRDNRPVISYSQTTVQQGSMANLYSDSGLTVCMTLRLMSYLMFALAPISLIAKVFELFGSAADSMSSGAIIATVVSGLTGALLYVIGGFVIVALIKILQNLMALPKKK